MATTTATTISVTHTISMNDTKTYATNTVHLEVSGSTGVTTLVHSPTVVNQTAPVVNQIDPVDNTPGIDGSITFSSVPLESGANRLFLRLASGTDLDVNGVTYTKIASSSINKVTNASTLAI